MYLSELELVSTYYPPAANMDGAEVTLYLERANAYALGVIGGMPNWSKFPPIVARQYLHGLKAAVALAFECFTKGETAQVDKYNGDITEAAPAGFWQRKDNRSHQWETIDRMLKPYADIFDSQVPSQSENGIMFL